MPSILTDSLQYSTQAQTVKGRKRGRSRILIDTPEKQQPAEDMLKQNRPKPTKIPKRAACRQLEVRLQSDSDIDEVVADLPKVDSGDEEHDATLVAPKDCIVVKFASKKAIRPYVGMIVKTTVEFADEFEVTFLTCNYM